MGNTREVNELAESERAAIESAARVVRERFPVANVVLFGSKARGEADEESDIDLLVLTTRALSWQERHKLFDALFDVEMEHNVVISALIVPRDEWLEGVYTVLPIHAEIERDGRQV